MDFIFSSTNTGSPELDEHLEHIRNVDWSSTEMGPIASWPQELLQLAHVMMLEPQPRLMLLGKANHMFYNPAYGHGVALDKHPKALGMEQASAWHEIDSAVLDAPKRTRESGSYLPRVYENYAIDVLRNGSWESLVLSWTLIPLARFANSSLSAVYVSLSDVTEAHIASTRSDILSELETACKVAKDIPSIWTAAHKSLSLHPREIPFALLYSVADGPSVDDSTNIPIEHVDGTNYRLEGTMGDCDASPRGLLQDCLPVWQVLQSKKEPILITSNDERFPRCHLGDLGKQAQSDVYNAAVICPVHYDGSDRVVGLVIIGLNTKCPYNEAYQGWLQEIAQALGNAVTTVTLIEEETKKEYEMTVAIATRDKEATALTTKFEWLQKVVQFSDVGVFSLDPSGRLIEANDSWYAYSNHPRLDSELTSSSLNFMDYVYEDDRESVLSEWIKITEGTPVTFEMRWKAAPGSQNPIWVLAACVPLIQDGVLISISGCTTNISAQKNFQTRIQAESVARADVNERLGRMQYIVEQVTAGIFEFTPEGVLIHSNDAYHAISGIPRASVGTEELVFSAYLYPDDIEVIMGYWKDMVNGNAATFEMRWKAPLNAYGEDFRWSLSACLPVKNSNGETTSILGCITDISSSKRAERETTKRAELALDRAEALERARVSELRFYRFIQAAPAAISITTKSSDGALRMTFANDAWFDMTKHPRVPFEEIEWLSLVHEDDKEVVAEGMRTIFSNKNMNIQFRLTTPWHGGDGPATPTWVMATALPEFSSEDGTLAQVIGTMTDISHLKFAESTQQLRIDQALEAKRQTENFIDMTSHEIRNPLSAVVHCADAISDSLTEMQVLVSGLLASPQQDKAKQLHEYIEGSLDATNTIKSCTSHQKRIVDDILVLSKLDSNLLHVAPVPTKVISILSDIDNLFEAETTREGINFSTKSDASLSEMNVDWLLLDQGRINQILINLITNAIKFTKNRDVRNVSVRMGAARQRHLEAFDVDYTLSQSLRDSIYDTPDFSKDELFLYFSVEDTGRGMTDEERCRIFARFQQASIRTYSEYGGSGLGLYISHSLVGLQGGEIGVATSPNVGSTFAFYVKTARCATPERVALPIRATLPADSTMSNGDSRRIHVLIVEDNLLNQRVLKKQLSKTMEVYTADHGQEALDFLKTTRHWKGTSSAEENHVDVILMDIEMPVMNGLACARAIRDLQKAGELRGTIPIIAVSANARPEQKAQAIAAGMDDAIAKPFRIPELTPKIDRLVSWARGT